MKLILTRRQFGQLAVLATAGTATGLFTNKILAQKPSTVILGARPGNISSPDTSADLNSDTTDLSDESATADIVPSALQTIVVESFDVGSQEVKTVLTTPPILETGEQVSGFVSLKDGRFVVTATNIDPGKKNKQSVRLIFLSDSPKSVAVSGLKNNEALRSLLGLKDGSVVGLVGKINGTPPSRIVTINPDTGNITDRDKIPDQKRVTAVAQCPEETFYGIATENTGETSVFQIGQEQLTKLSFNGQPWNNGFIGLVCGASNQLYGLGALRHQEYPFYLHSIDPKTGEIKRIGKGFNVSAITIP
ncbi:hypothetical protein OGM63_10905 [Plectonema radiosum NIES-515]|uniref:Uncharacterized protein n=1 Tax=Plectonema radiosum NIES-515 TaxID=2986073 RepID=A0ABT3AY23_9CYAN|nr:hypothetical protein [Plectonema radiosum]MCV3214017.1 hypothetical protein [Plectonema radiosum NIES-515]